MLLARIFSSSRWRLSLEASAFAAFSSSSFIFSISFCLARFFSYVGVALAIEAVNKVQRCTRETVRQFTYLKLEPQFLLIMHFSLMSNPCLLHTSLTFFSSNFNQHYTTLTKAFVPFYFLLLQRLVRVEVEFVLLKRWFNCNNICERERDRADANELTWSWINKQCRQRNLRSKNSPRSRLASSIISCSASSNCLIWSANVSSGRAL